ncbi:MAG: hypothetical protein JWO94_1238 [Verrucomicrobiaceae bacterium]|nr:hypothetical protein [Verrucomicrobiaceae bacterium]
MGDIEDFARREPTKAVAAAFGVGLLINLLPTRLVIGAATAVGATLLRPTLLTLGVTKALELCFPSNKQTTRP